MPTDLLPFEVSAESPVALYVCKRAGHVGDRNVPEWEWFDPSHCCRTCINRYVHERHHARRGHAAYPPDGYVPLRIVAAQLGYSVNWVAMQIARGNWFQGDTWRRYQRGMIFVRESAVTSMVCAQTPIEGDSDVPCARAGCGNHLSRVQVARNGRYCTLRCQRLGTHRIRKERE